MNGAAPEIYVRLLSGHVPLEADREEAICAEE